MKKSLLQKVVSITLGVSTILWSFGVPLGVLFAPSAARAASAVVISDVRNFQGAGIKASSGAVAVAKISVTASAVSQNLGAVTVNLSGTGFATTDLATLATGDTSGVALYQDHATLGTVGSFDTTNDTVVTLASAPVFSSGSVTLIPASPPSLTSGTAVIFYVAIKTSGTAANGHQIVPTIPADGVMTTDGSGPSSSITLFNSLLVVDTIVPTISSVSGFSGSATVTVNFSEPVQKVNGGALAFVEAGDPLTYVDGAPTAQTISSITHNAGQPMAMVTMSGNLDAGDVDGTATMAAGTNKISDMAGNVMLATPATNFGSPLSITTVNIPCVTVGTVNNVDTPIITFAATGGTIGSGYKWRTNSVADTAVLENLLGGAGNSSIKDSADNTTGKLFGTTTVANAPGMHTFSLTVTDSATPTVATATRQFTIPVAATSCTGSAAFPAITGVTPAGGAQGSSVSITITGTNTTFATTSTVTVSLPPGVAGTNGITVGTIVRNSATSITAPLTIAAGDAPAALGARDVRVVTGAEVANMPGGFGVFASGGSGLGLLLPTDAQTSVPLPSPAFNFTPSASASLTSYRITVASTSDFATKVWDYTFPKPSDVSNTNASHCNSTGCNVMYGQGTFLIITQPVPLAPNTTYYWKVSTYAEAVGSVSAAPAALETTAVRSFTTTASVTDVAPPGIEHRPVFQATASTNLVMFARVMDNLATTATTPALSSKAYYCAGASCNPITQVAGSSVGAGYFTYTIPSATISTAGTIVRYYLQASDGTNTQTFYSTPTGTAPIELTSVAGGGSAITGTVNDSTNTCATAVQSARVFAEGTGFSAITNGSCAFTLGGSSPNGLFAGTYDLVAVKDGYGDRRIDGIPAGATAIPFQLSSGAGGGFGGDTTKPMVRFTMPGNDMTNMPGGDSNMKIVVVFSKSMSTNSVTATGNMTVNEVNTATGVLTNITATKGSWTYYSTAPAGIPMIPPEANMAVWSLTSPNTLGDNNTIAVIVTSNVTDTAGNSVQGNQSDGSYAFSFTTSNSSFMGTLAGGQSFGSGAFMPPRVTGTTPTPGSSSAPTNTKVVINFSDPMADDSGTYVLKNFVTLFTLSSTGVETNVSSSAINTVTLNTAKTAATLNLKSTYNSGAFVASTRYRLKVLGGAKGSSGMTLGLPGQESNVFYTSEFTTGTGSDTGAPMVVGSYPNTGDTGVQVNVGAVSIGFSKDMDPSTISASTITLTVGSTAVNGTVEYKPLERQAFFIPRSALTPSTTYTITVTTGATGLNTTPLTSAVTRTFTTGSADSTVPAISFVNADDFGVALTFTEPMNAAKATDTLNWATSVLNPLTYDVIKYGAAGFDPASAGTVIPLTGVTMSYDSPSNTVMMTGFTLASYIGQELYFSMDTAGDNVAKDLSSNAITTAGNTARVTIANSATTMGALGPMAMTTDAFSMGGTFVPTNFSSTTFGFAPPVDVKPFNMMAGKSTIYGVRLPISRQIPASGTIVLTFPTGFNVAGAQQDINSPMRTDLNGPGTGTPTFKCTTNVTGGKSCAGGATVTGDTSAGGDAATRGGLADDGVVVNNTARTVTITLSAATNSGGNDFLNIDIAGIVNSTVPKDFNTSGYTVDIKTKNGTTLLESLTSMPFFIQTAGTYTLSGTITATGATAGTAKVYLMSPMTGPTETTSGEFAAGAASYSFTSLSAGDYMLFTDQTVTLTGGEFTGKTIPERVVISEATDLASDSTDNDVIDYDFTLADNASGGTDVTLTVTNNTGASQLLDVFAGSSTGFKVKQVTANAGANTFTLNLANGKWFVGVGPQMPKGPMGGPPPAPSYVMPKPVEITLAGTPPDSTGVENSGTANDKILVFTLTTAGKQITGLVKDGANKVMANAEVYAYDPQGGFGTHANTDTAGAFTMQVVDGSYIVGSFVPGMPPSKEVAVVVTSHATDYLAINGAAAITPAAAATSFILKVAKPDYTISGKVTDGTNTVQGASVFSYRTDGPGFANANTDSAGTYTLYVSNGTWRVGVFLPQYGNLAEQTITIASASQSNVNFTPTATGTFYAVSGRVYRDNNNDGDYDSTEEIQGAFVRITGNSTSNEAITGADGTYSFNVPAGNGYVLKAFAPGIGELPPLAAFNVAAATPNKDIRVGVIRTITVTLSSSVTEAFVDLFSSTGVGGHTTIRNTTTGTLSLPDGSYRVEARIPGSAIGFGNVAATDAETTTYSNTTGIVVVDSNEGLTVTVPALRTVTGTVTDGTNNIADAWVEIFNSATGAHTGTKSAATTGAFTLRVPDSTTDYRINAMKPGYFRDATALTVNGANPDAQTITVATATLSISGTVYIGATGAANAFVRAEKQGGGFSGTQADANGIYSLPVNAGTWRVYAVAEGYAEGTAATPAVVAASSVTGVDITLSTLVTLNASKSKPITPSSGGTMEDATAGIKVTFPASALGSSTSAGNVQIKETNNIRSTSTAKPVGGTAQEIKVTDSTGTPITTFASDITIERTLTLAQLNATASATDSSVDTLAEAQSLTMRYWDESLQNWIPESSTVTYKDSTGAIITDSTTIDTAAEFAANVSTVVLTTITDHLSAYAPISSTSDEAPSTPTGLAASAAGTSAISLTWTVVSGATSYDIYRSASSGGTYTRLGAEPTVSSGSTVTYTDSSLPGNTTYYYKISALNSSGESAASSAVSATTAASSGGGGGSTTTITTPTTTPTTPAETPDTTPTTPAETPAETPVATPTTTPELQLVAIPAVPANPTVVQIQAAITAILNNINYLRAQLAIIVAQEAAAIIGVPAACQGVTFTRGLTPNIIGNDVKCLQAFLNQSSDTQIVDFGPGSKDFETNFFGQLTASAVGKFQIKYGLVSSSADAGYGYVGPKTRAKLNSLLAK